MAAYDGGNLDRSVLNICQIRDEWGFVYQLLGLNSTAISVDLGEIVSAGHVIGATSRTPLSWEPPCRHKPSDPPKMYDNSRRYPYRNRVLRVLVARPDPEWKEWKRPLGAFGETGVGYCILNCPAQRVAGSTSTLSMPSPLSSSVASFR